VSYEFWVLSYLARYRDVREGLRGSGWLIWFVSFISSIWFIWFTDRTNETNKTNQRNQINQRNELSAMEGRGYMNSARKWLSGQERAIAESGTEEEPRNSLAGGHPKSEHRGKGRPHWAKRPSLIRL
jgi:hypothetical protein